jgi:N utilization substance protein B
MLTAKKKGRYGARIAAIQALYSFEQTQTPVEEIAREFVLDGFTKNSLDGQRLEPDVDFFRYLATSVAAPLEAFDEIITGHMKKSWGAERLALVMRNLLRCACYELVHDILTPTPVILDQYIEIAKDFFPDGDVAFVNGILNAIAREVRPSTKDNG